MMTRAEVAAARALRDCGVIRVRFDHPGYISLYEKGLVRADPVDGDDDALDYRPIPHFSIKELPR